MIKKNKKILAYMLALTLFSVYVVMDTFVITRVYGEAEQAVSSAETGSSANGETAETQDSQSGAQASDDFEEGQHGPGDKSGKGMKPGSGSGQGKMRGPGSGNGPGKGKMRGGKPGMGKAGGSSKNGSSSSGGSSKSTQLNTASSANSYSDGKVSVELKEYTTNNTTVHVAEVSLKSAEYLKTAFAQNAYGRNVTETTSSMADSNNAIIAINGDYYGSQEKGYVIRNGKIYRSTSAGREDLVIYKDGSFEIINEGDVTAEQLLAKGAVQTLSFGPALVENGSVSVDEGDEVGRAMASNPRTAIGIKTDGTYLFVVSDGRTDESEGLSLKELADFMKEQGAVTAYNLDGGGSSTMVFNGSVVNTPTGGGIGNGSGSERKVSDIVYIGY